MVAVDRTLPWLGYPPAVDLANTVVVSPDAAIDLLTSEEELAAWVAAERGRIPGLEAAAGRLGEMRALRDTLRAVLHAAAQGQSLPGACVADLNAASARAPSYPALQRGGAVDHVELAADPFAVLCAVLARSAMQVLSGPDRERLAICRAPSCGMLFLREHRRQAWCCKACGNRARVARHARRHHRPLGSLSSAP